MTMRNNPTGGAPDTTGETRAKMVTPGGMPGDEVSPETRRAAHLHPGDQLPAGVPGAGENICPTCNGSGRHSGESCPTCGGTGKVIESVAGGP